MTIFDTIANQGKKNSPHKNNKITRGAEPRENFEANIPYGVEAEVFLRTSLKVCSLPVNSSTAAKEIVPTYLNFYLQGLF